MKRVVDFTVPAYLVTGRGADRVRRKVLCSEQSLTQAEFFSANQAQGIKPKKVLYVPAVDYKGESLCELGGVTYTVYRTFNSGGRYTELYLTYKAGEQNGS